MTTTPGSPFTNCRPVSISSRFNLDSSDLRDADILFLTRDQVFFYAHRSVLLQHSINYFGGLLANDAQDQEEIDVNQPMSDSDTPLSLEPKLVMVDTSSDVMNVVLLALYQLSIQEFTPSTETLREVIPTLANFGYKPTVIAYPQSELYGLLLRAAAADPLPMYAAAAQYSFESLAVSISALTLRSSLLEITDELAQQMGPVYLRRLFFLHFGRADALRRIVIPLPNLHPPDSNPRCDSETQKSIQRAWTLASAYMIAQNHAGDMNKVVSSLSTQVNCTDCGRSLQERISRLVHDWSIVKYTI